MPVVNIKGVGNAQFPDGMAEAEIKSFLAAKYPRAAQMTHQAPQSSIQQTAQEFPNLAQYAEDVVSGERE